MPCETLPLCVWGGGADLEEANAEGPAGVVVGQTGWKAQTDLL